MGNHINSHINSFLPSRDEINLPNIIKYSFISLGFVKAFDLSFKMVQKTKRICSSKIHLNGNKDKWAFILNATSKVGAAVSDYLAKKKYNLILASFQADKLDTLKANLFFNYDNISIEPYYLYKSDMKNFEEKFHFKEFLQKYDIEVFILNDCLEHEKNEDFLEINYGDFQFELSKKFLLKTFLMKIILENAKSKQSFFKKKNSPIYLWNINIINRENDSNILNNINFEEFWDKLIAEKYSEDFNLQNHNVIMGMEVEKIDDNENISNSNIIKAIFK